MAIQVVDRIDEVSSISGATTQHMNAYGTLKPNQNNRRMIEVRYNSSGSIDIKGTGYLYTTLERRRANATVLREDTIELKNQNVRILDTNIMTALYTEWKKSFKKVRDI